MKIKAILNYNIDIQKQEQNIKEFKALTLAMQKQHLMELLDIFFVEDVIILE